MIDLGNIGIAEVAAAVLFLISFITYALVMGFWSSNRNTLAFIAYGIVMISSPGIGLLQLYLGAGVLAAALYAFTTLIFMWAVHYKAFSAQKQEGPTTFGGR